MEGKGVIFLMLLFLTLVPLTTAYEFCENTISKTKLEVTEIIYQKQADETTWTWTPSEEMNIEVSVTNKNFTKRDFTVELFLLDEDLNLEENFMEDNTDSVRIISLDEGRTETLNFSFQLKGGIAGIYSLHAKIYDADNESICTNLRAISTGEEATIEIAEEEKIIIIRNIKGPINITPGSYVEYTIEVINLGNIAEEQILIIAYNANLKIREEREIIGLEIEESKNVTFGFTIPENATIQEERFLFSTEYSYKNATGNYYEYSEKDKILLVQIETLESQAIQINETQNQTQTNQTVPSTTTEDKEDTSGTPYLWPIIITISLLLIIAIATSFFLKYKKDHQAETPSTTPSLASDYVKNIQKNTTPQPSPPTPPNKPS